MVKCFKCGVSGDKVRLFDAISGTGITNICEKCSIDEDIPIIRKPTTFQLKESERKQTVYEKLSGAAGVNFVEHTQRFSVGEESKRKLLDKQETTLRDIVDRNYKPKLSLDSRPRVDLIENFHWVIMRSRRKKKLTQADLAKEIFESVTAIKMAEQGILPEDDYKFLNKLEVFLGVNLVKNRPKPKDSGLASESISIVTKEDFEKGIKFDPLTSKTITISDLQKMKNQEAQKESSEIQPKKQGFWRRKFGRGSDLVEEETDLAAGGDISGLKLEDLESKDEDLSDEEMGDLIFRK